MSLNAAEIHRIVFSLQQAMHSAVIREVLSDRRPNRITIIFRGLGENFHLHLCLDAAFCRMVRIPNKPRNAESPHPFVMLLRKTLIGRRLSCIETVGNDRVVRMVLDVAGDTLLLVCELTGRHANLFLLQSDETIVASFFPNRSNLRNLTPGEPYVPPFSRPAEPQDRFANAKDIETAVEAYYRGAEQTHEAAALRSTLLRSITTKHKKNRKLHSGLMRDLERARGGEQLFGWGQVLKGALSTLKRGMSAYTGTDYEGLDITIPLLPELSPVENMNRLFEKAKRLSRARGPIERRIRTVESEIAALERQIKEIESAPIETLRAQATSGERDGNGSTATTSRRSQKQERRPYREFIIHGARPVRVGRSAKDNDLLTLRHAKPDDLWLHVRSAPGSHVVVPMGRKETPHPMLLVDAAHLAAHFSTRKGSADVEVIYTRRRYVQKQKGSAPGSVRLLKEKCIVLRVEPERLDRLLHGEAVYTTEEG